MQLLNEVCDLIFMVLQKELDVVDERLRKDAKPAMVCTANDLQEWKDFPKGLKVLLLQEDTTCGDEIRTKLEAMDYDVSIFCDMNEALSAILNRPEGFHVAIVEVSSHSCEGGFKFLENTKDLPTIMTSNNDCLNTMMKCIALGAVEFLSKPLSEDKLRNIWQHVVHRAFNAGVSVSSESLKPVKESVVSISQLQTDNEQPESRASVELEKVSRFSDSDHEHYPAPSTPQLKQVERLLDDGDCQEQTNYSTEKESGEHDGESKSVETTCETLNAESIRQERTNCSIEKESGEHDGESKSVETTCENLNAESTLQEQTNCSMEKESGEHDVESKSVETTCENLNGESTPQQRKSEITLVQKEEEDFMDTSKCESVVSPHPQNVKVLTSESNATAANKVAVHHRKCEIKANRKKMKVDWTPELHKKFVKAVEQLGIDHAIPSRILDLMKVEGLTRHNVASHLQKYRMHRRHILPKQEDRKWLNQRDPMQRSYYLQRPIVPGPPSYYSNHTLPAAPLYNMWGQSGSQMTGMPIWAPSSYPLWQPTGHWQPFPGMHSGTWGSHVLPPPPQAQCFSYNQNIPALRNDNAMDYTFGIPYSSLDNYPEEEIIDKAVREAMSKPWLPLPIGLKPPSTDSVLTELSSQGISSIPPSNNSFIPI